MPELCHISREQLTIADFSRRLAAGEPVLALCGAQVMPRPRGDRPVCASCAEQTIANGDVPVDWTVRS